MKLLYLLTLTVFLFASNAQSQTRKTSRSSGKKPARALRSAESPTPPVIEVVEPPPPPPPRPTKAPTNERFASGVFRDVSISRWGVAAVSLPDDLTSETESTSPTDNGRIKWTTYSRYWKQSPVFYPSSLEVDLYITTWETDFKNLVPDLRADLATPENLVLLDFTADLQRKNKPGSFVLEAQILKIGELEGSFSAAEMPSDKKRFLVVWSTYRYHENKAQRILLSVTGRNEEMTKALKIINSLKFEKPLVNQTAKTF